MFQCTFIIIFIYVNYLMNYTSEGKIIESFNTEASDLNTSLHPMERKKKKNNSCIHRLMYNVLFSFSLVFFILSIITYNNNKTFYSSYSESKETYENNSAKFEQLESEIVNVNKEINEKSVRKNELMKETGEKGVELQNTQDKYEHLSRSLYNNDRDLSYIAMQIGKLSESIDNYKKKIDILTSSSSTSEELEEERKNYLSSLQSIYISVMSESTKYAQKKHNIRQINDSIVHYILHTDVIQSDKEYSLLLSWLSESKVSFNSIEMKFNVTMDEKNIEDLFKKEKELLSSKKPILMLVSLGNDERFGYVILPPQTSIFQLNMNDNGSFLFSLNKQKKYTLKQCKDPSMKTTYILSFRRDMEIMLPNACFENDDFFAVEERKKFYRTKKHFDVVKVEIYLLK